MQVEAGFHRGRQQMLCVLAPLLIHNVTHRLADRAGVTCQHIFDLSIREGQPGFSAHLLPNVIHAADHAEFQAVGGIGRRDGVVDVHKVYCPAAQIHEEHGRFILQKPHFGHKGGVALGEDGNFLDKHFCVLYKIRLKKLEGRILQEFYNYKYREEGLSAKTLRNYHMALHKCLQQAVKERLIVTNPCDAVTLPSGEKPEIAALTNEQQRALVQISYRHRYGVFVRLDLSTGLRMGELLALRWEDIDLVGAQLTVKRTINRLARYEQDEGKHSTEIVFDTPKTQNARRTIPLTRSVIEDLKRWRSIQLADQNAAGAAYQDTGFVVTNELGMYFEQRTFKDYYNRMLQDAGIGHFTFHALRHTFATRALERGMDYKTLSAILGHYSVSFTMDTYVHSMDEHKRNEMDKMDDLFGISLEISVEQQPYPVLFTVTEEGCKAFAPDFPKIQIQAGTMETALMEAKKQIQKALSQFKYPPIPTRQEDIVVQENSVLILLKTA